MQNKRFLFLTLVFLLIAAATLAADPIEGFWKSVDEEGEPTAFWEIYIQGGRAYGRIVKLIGRPEDTVAENVEASYADHPERRSLNTLPVIGVSWIYNLEPRRNEGEWTRGFIIDPEDGRRYALDLNFLPGNHRRAVDGQETLEVKGKIAIFSRSQYWVRSSQAEVNRYRD
jgi:uncharacterized protein (DUF2147 family)